MKEQGIEGSSPDVADGAVLTFADNTQRVSDDDFEVLILTLKTFPGIF